MASITTSRMNGFGFLSPGVPPGRKDAKMAKILMIGDSALSWRLFNKLFDEQDVLKALILAPKG
jgi:hypothetical protein